MGRHELIPLAERARWATALSGLPHGHAHTSGFCRAVQLTSGLPTYLYAYEDDEVRVVCPLAEREFGGAIDVVSPYGFGGFATRGRLPSDWDDFARSRGWVCGYVALNPLFCEADGFADVQVHNRLYVMDLGGDVRSRLSENRRRQLRELALGGGHARARPRAAGGVPARALRGLLRPARSRRRDRPLGGHDGRDRRAGRRHHGRRGTDGTLESVAVFGHTQHAGDYLFNVSIPGGERHAVHLIWFAVERLRELGVPSLNLGGGVREGDDLAEFKRRFGATPLPLASLRSVPARRLRAPLPRGGATSDRSGWFPPYRAAGRAEPAGR